MVLVEVGMSFLKWKREYDVLAASVQAGFRGEVGMVLLNCVVEGEVAGKRVGLCLGSGYGEAAEQ